MQHIIGLALGIILCAMPTSAAHLPMFSWMPAFCCGDMDCTETTVVMLDQTHTHTDVLIGAAPKAVQVANFRVLPSRDGHNYVCFVPTTLEVPMVLDGRPYAMRVYKDSTGLIRAVPPAAFTRDNVRCVFLFAAG